MKVDLVKLTRLNRIAVCGRCKHQFDVSVHLGTVADEPEPVAPSSPIRLTPSHIPLIEPMTPIPTGEAESVPPVSGPYRAEDDHSPAPFSRTKRRSSPASGWPQSETPPGESRDSSWPRSARPRLGWSKRTTPHEQDTEPSLPRADHDTEPGAKPPELELDLPNNQRGVAKKSSLVRKKRKEIVVEVGDRKGKKRRRNTYSPESLVTEPDLKVPRVEGEDES